MAKRIFDFLFALILIVILSPVIVVVASLVWLFIGLPILFVQERPGYKGKIFKLLKFRTMKDLKDHNGNFLDDSERITAFGRILRKTSLDELPELINVLRGEMSFVGPRPLLVEYLPLYSKEQMRRHDVLPGITGLAQINGRNNLDWEKRFEMDLYYVDHHTLLMDLKIIMATVFKVLLAKDIEKQGHATMTRFEGRKGG